MAKNIIIVLLVGLVAFLLISSVNSGNNTQTKTEETQQTDKSFTLEKIENSGKSLDLSNQGLEKLPSYVLEDPSLEVLDISNNNLTGALPGEIRLLQNLQVLKASENEMTGVPAEIGLLAELEVLDLSNNQLTGLPQEMRNLRNLKTLNLSGNNYSEQDLEIIKQGLPSDIEIIL